jgi:HEAT repeat protein
VVADRSAVKFVNAILTNWKKFMFGAACVMSFAGNSASSSGLSGDCVAANGVEWSLKDCGNRGPTKVKDKSGKMTHELAAGFGSSAVREYVARVRSAQVPIYVVTPPREYSDVVNLGKVAVPFLLEEIGAQDEMIRGAALRGLSSITNKNFARIEDLRNLGSARGLELRETYADWWEKHKNQSRTEWLIDDLSASDFGTQRGAVNALREEGDASAIPALRRSLKDEKLAFYSAEALATLGDRAAVPYLVDLYLTHEMLEYRRDGICLLFKLTGQTLDYDPGAPSTARQAAIERWKTWWQENAPDKR